MMLLLNQQQKQVAIVNDINCSWLLNLAFPKPLASLLKKKFIFYAKIKIHFLKCPFISEKNMKYSFGE